MAFSAAADSPALESLKISVPFSTVSRPSDKGLGEPGFAAAGLASATEGVNSQFGLPSALISRTIFGSTSVTSATSTSPTSKASSEGFTVTDFTSTMLGFFEPARLKNFDAVELDAGRRQQRQADRTVDDDVATRCALHLRHDLGLVGIDVDEQRQGQQRDDQQADEAGGADQKPLAVVPCHERPPTPG